MRKYFLAFLALFVSLIPTHAMAADPEPSGYYANLSLVKEIFCTAPDGLYSGTAEYVGKNLWLTASHVIHGTISCTIDGKKLRVVEDNTKLDYATMAFVAPTDLPEEKLNIACDPFRRGERYLAVGWALGEDFVIEPMIGTTDTETQEGFEGETLLVGKSFEGMSGGPIFDEQGFVVGIVNGGDQDGRSSMVTRTLLGTSLCR